jgi:hypothetical protein
MKKSWFIAVFLLVAATGLADELKYSLDYQIRGSASSRLLFFFPLRVYYDVSASINFTACTQPDGKTKFVFESIPRSAYVLRTLGFSAKSLALLSADMDESRNEIGADDILALWQKEAPDFAARIKNVRKFPHFLVMNGRDGLSFTRDGDGRYGDFFFNLETRPVDHASQTGIYFNIFPLLGELLKVLNHPCMPSVGSAPVRFPVEWEGDWLDFSSDLNRMGVLLEKIVKSLVTVEQKFPFRLKFHVSNSSPEEVEICAEAFPDVPVWKSFMIREILRRVRVRLADGVLLFEELWIGLRNNKGQGGFGRLRLQLIN